MSPPSPRGPRALALTSLQVRETKVVAVGRPEGKDHPPPQEAARVGLGSDPYALSLL